MYAYSLRIRRTLAIGLLLGSTLIAYFLILLPITEKYWESVSSIDKARHNYSRFKNIAEGGSSKHVSSERFNPEKYKSNFLSGDSNDAILADIQKRVKVIVARSGAQFRSARTLPSKLEDRVQLLGVRIELSGRLDAIKRTFFGVETSSPFLIIESAQLKPTLRRTAPKGPSQIFMSAQIDVFGIVWSELNP